VRPKRELRTTEQRRVIMEELAKSDAHPTADELYRLVRKRLPKISLGTVYRNLEILSRSGKIHKLETAGSQKRFDGVVENHYHVRCVRCDRIEDVPGNPIDCIDEAFQGVKGYQILQHRLEILGICPQCLKESNEMGRGDSKVTGTGDEGASR
jgi:Fe2+ or Zn2+ uptake regulation protein